MDLLKMTEQDSFQKLALHRTNTPRPVLVPNGNGPILTDVSPEQERLIRNFSDRRTFSRRTASMGGDDVFAAIPRFYSPMEYFQAQKIPYRINVEDERFKLYQWLDLFYRTHYLIPILVDIFTRFPLVGIELDCPDPELKTFYEDLFFERMDYEHFLVDLGREYWTLGQAFPLGHFNETLGIWEDEELIDPTMVKVRNYPIIGGEQFFFSSEGMETLRTIVEKREPREIYYLLERDYPEWIPFLLNKKDIPVSNVLLKQVAFKAGPRDLHGTPILLRALRTLLHEEKLIASQDAIAERLYSPAILVEVGIQDMGQNRGPWIPTPAEVQSIRDQFDVMLSSDFRVMVHHFGLKVQSIFGRDQMPRLDQDFDRIEQRLMMTFGVNPSLLQAGSATQPYASSALQAEFLNQILRTYQRFLINHYKQRASIVAEAQEHYDYEKRGDSRVPIMEEVLEYDEETGEEIIREKNKLLIPEMRMKVLDLRDEATQRQFLQALKQQGVPIPDQDIAMGMHYDFVEALGKTEEEMVQKTVSQQEAKVKTYDILTAKGLPIPVDLKQEVEGMQGFSPPQPGTPLSPGVDVPTGGDIAMPPPPGGTGAIGPYDADRGDRPEQSDEGNPIPPPGQVPNQPMIPGVPGQPGMLGVPGAGTPAISSSVKKLPRKQAKDFTVPDLTKPSKDDTIESSEDGESE